MISFIKGKILNKEKNLITVMTSGGLGFEINLSNLHAGELKMDQEVELNTYLKVSENAMELYGFRTMEEKDFFGLLLSVSGIGPKGAMNVLNLGSIEQIQSAISRGDTAYLTQVQGMGKKTAERVVVELKSKISKQPVVSGKRDEKQGEKLGEVMDGLVAMGYSKDEAKRAVVGLETEDKTTEELLKQALSNK
ncbi:MAG: Holliday junction branch migration protein RuvA [Candidatus Magasanikbacteria bacterium]|nr:Holliday junction branch migration protein RuvA [Candidatus Magasanikbacteria bacterium]